MRKLLSAVALILTAAFVIGILPQSAGASSHREAPLISQDAVADTTDVYMFVSPDRPDTVTMIQSVYPAQDAGSGPNFYRFGDDVRYTFEVDNDGDSQADISFAFTFRTVVVNKDTFLYNTGPVTSLDDPNLNVRQFYTVTRVDYGHGGAPARSTTLFRGLQTPPSNIGAASTPNYASLMSQATYQANGRSVFAGQTDDAFFIDLGAIFDLLTIRPGAPGNNGGGFDTLAGFNVQSIALQLPISELTDCRCVPNSASDPNAVIGMWATSSRRALTVLDPDGNKAPVSTGEWAQVSRLGMPLVNELVIPLRDKDRWNRSLPKNDGQFLDYVLDPELARLLNALYGVSVPPAPRNDLVAVFLTGVPGLNQPADVVPSEQMRLNVAIPPCSSSCSSLGVLGGDLAGYPNGRRLADDVTDISLRAVAGVLVDGFNIFPNNALGDGVDENDVAFQAGFPYIGMPHSGLTVGNHDRLQP